MNRTNGLVAAISRVVQASHVRALKLQVDTGLFRAEYVPQSETTDDEIVWRFWRKHGADGQYFDYILRDGIYPFQLDELQKILTKAEMTLFLEFEPFFAEFRTLLSWDHTLAKTIKKLADSATGC